MSFVYRDAPAPPSPLRAAILAAYREDETAVVERILAAAELAPDALDRIAVRARGLVVEVRRQRLGKGGLDAFLHEYALASKEGIVLMCLAEALLRIPDSDTVDRLIRDKLGPADWSQHLGQSDSLFVNASTWALMLTGRLFRSEGDERDLGGVLKRLVARSGEPVVRQAVTAAMRILGRQFVMGRTIAEALERARSAEKQGYRHSYDMLGEAARTAADARRYFESYEAAITAIGTAVGGADVFAAPGISVKLSALHPRYEEAQRERALKELTPLVLTLARHAKAKGIGFTVDAEESERLDLSLDIIEVLALDPALAGWDGFGLAIQAYQKRCLPLIDWLSDLARRARRRLMVRLVKGAYWDSEIKRSQERGLAGYPVFTRKVATDVSYLACVRRLLAAPDAFYAQFATHNAHTLAAILELAGTRKDYEFQRLHGMGEALYEQIVGADKLAQPCRVYAPVGSHEDLLAYLVRRLLENGANTSFVNRIVDDKAPIDEIITDPVARLRGLQRKPHPRIPLPRDLYGAERRNASGPDLSSRTALAALKIELEAAARHAWTAAPIVGGTDLEGSTRPARDPSYRARTVGTVADASAEHVERALARAATAAPDWDAMPVGDRAAILERVGDLYESRLPALVALIVREGGRTIPDAVSEVREAVDFCRYYAMRARADFAPVLLPGPTGERNALELHGRGIFACISPWNFPLAIFTGQIAAALVAGNAVIAKPAEQTPMVGAAAVRLMHQAGVPVDALHLLPGDGATVGARLTGDPRVAGIAFTGSTETARAINLVLAQRGGPMVPLIAETGGQNALIVDSSALPEQVVQDVLLSAFNSAGQRCSALRILCVQADIADRVVTMLKGAMAELAIGDPALLSTDVGPVIDEDARGNLQKHAERMAREGSLLYQCVLPPEAENGTFFAPRAFEIDRIGRLDREVFGPILHVVRWQRSRFDQLLDAIAATGYGLTLGIHSRIDETVEAVHHRLKVGNTYVNRNMIGAVVGVQPFGGEGLSGTGPKAGGPHYLYRFALERTLSVDTTAAGGNASLLSLEEEAPS
ncbi:MAG TPA: bifunctional proline dehydrogenase/L-glutamate gamma-semialdehyde dehydrogenase PutA [Stellaceae bacterium]|nr:bifunctional proline dehydrogenase/L-glutamate gamma-semialdehyde dehydrogenase PutA [Stellaceae bacterium]